MEATSVCQAAVIRWKGSNGGSEVQLLKDLGSTAELNTGRFSEHYQRPPQDLWPARSTVLPREHSFTDVH